MGVCVWREVCVCVEGRCGSICVCGGEVWECVWREVWEGVYGVVEALPSIKVSVTLQQLIPSSSGT